jgi:hypothetical protein
MNRITLFLMILIGCTAAGYAQCIRNTQYPNETFVSDNSGFLQTINTCVYPESDYSRVDALVPGASYLFTCEIDGNHQYVTITDLDNVELGHGFSPFTVEVNTSSIRVHYSENQLCEGSSTCATAKIQMILSCPFPQAVTISNITTSNATFNWSPAGEETAWEVLVLADGAPAPTAGMMGFPITDEPEYIHSGLAPALHYNFYVRSNCGDEYSPWSAPFPFASGCNPVAELQQGFEDAMPPSLPTCWTGLVVNANWASVETVWNSNSGTYAVQLANGEGTENSKIMLISPAMSTVNTGTHRVKFYAKGFGSAPLEVGTVTSTTADAVFTSVMALTVGDTYQEYTVDFTGYDGDDVHFAFRHPSPDMYNPVFIDDIRWELAPLCPDVTNIKIASVSTDSASVTWDAGNETSWDVVFSTDINADPTTLTPISPAPQDESVGEITGLAHDTEYHVWVRSTCGEVLGNGAWIGPVNFQTPCLPVATFTQNFNSVPFGEMPTCWTSIVEGPTVSSSAFVYVTSDGINETNGVELSNYDSGSSDEIILVSPNLSTLTTGTHRLKFYGRSGASIEVGTLSSPVGANNFTAFETIQLTPTYTEYVVDFSSYGGTDTFIGIRHTGASYIRVLLDNIRWEEIPACPDVTSIAVSDVTANAALVTWESQGPENQWDVVLGGEDDSDPSTLPLISPAPTGTPEINLTNLTDNTPYNVWVRSACGDPDGNGAWIGPIAFRTSCIPVETLNEGFEDVEYGEVPSCWTALTYGPTVAEWASVRTVTFAGFESQNSVELWSSDSGADDYVMLVSPALNTVSTATHRLKLRAFTYSQGTLEIGTMNGNSETALFSPFDEIVVTPNYTEFVINFDTYEGTDTYFALRNITPNVSLFVDNIRWEVLPPCPDVEAITASEPTTEGATISWTADGGVAGFQVAYGAADVTDPFTLTPTAIQQESEYTITGLADNYNYKVWVRSVCGEDGDGIWMGPLSLTTLCQPTTVPYVEDFESAVTPALPSCSVMQNAGFGNNWATEDAPGFGFESRTLVYEYNNDNNANVWFYTRGITLTANTDYSVSYRYGNNSDDWYVEKMKVAVGFNPDAEAMTEILADHDQINSGAALSNEIIFTPSETGVYYFGFHAYSNPGQYDLFLDDIQIDAMLGTPAVSETTFNYYPNPVKDKLHLTASDNISDVEVYNLLGQVVMQQTASQKEVSVDMSALPTGSYIVKLTAGSYTKTLKVLKK